MQSKWNDISLDIKELTCVRGGRRVYENLALGLSSGKLLIVRGGNGCGKSTLLRQIAGFLPVYEGRINLATKDQHFTLADSLHYAGHQSGVKPYLTVAENLNYWAQLFDGAGSLGAALAFWGLQALRDTPARLLSEGQKRRVGLARLLLAPRPLWLLDEPNVGLDVANLEKLDEAIKTHLSQGGMVMMASHVGVNITQALEQNLEKFAPKPVLLDEGEVV